MKNKRLKKCARCASITKKELGTLVDDKFICRKCLYGDLEPFKIYPIGFVKNNLQRCKQGFGTVGKKGLSRIELIESQKRFLYKLEDEKYITVVYYLHETREVKSVFARGLDAKKVGVFASRTPYRLSRIAAC